MQRHIPWKVKKMTVNQDRFVTWNTETHTGSNTFTTPRIQNSTTQHNTNTNANINTRLHNTTLHEMKTKQHKTTKYNTKQNKTRQDMTWHDNTIQSKTRQDKTRHDKTRQDKTRQDKTRQDKTRQDKTRQDKTRHHNTTQHNLSDTTRCTGNESNASAIVRITHHPSHEQNKDGWKYFLSKLRPMKLQQNIFSVFQVTKPTKPNNKHTHSPVWGRECLPTAECTRRPCLQTWRKWSSQRR